MPGYILHQPHDENWAISQTDEQIPAAEEDDGMRLKTGQEDMSGFKRTLTVDEVASESLSTNDTVQYILG